MAVQLLKFRDTLPILEVTLLDPDGSVHDLTGSVARYLHIWLTDGSKITREMTVHGSPSDGTLRYAWVANDWDDDNPDGYLIQGPALPPARGIHEHRMEYEVVGAAGARLTFPNGGLTESDNFDILRIGPDIGQGA